MRGSIHYQTGELAKVLFAPGMSKKEQKATGCIANAKTLETYREVWNELAHYVKNEYGTSDLQQLTKEHIQAFMLQKAFRGITEQYLETISSSLGKLETALSKLHEQFSHDQYYSQTHQDRHYDFSVRHTILKSARNSHIVIETSDNANYTRAYENPKALIEALSDVSFKLAARIQYESGARLEGVQRIDNYMRVKTEKLKLNGLIDTIEYIPIDDIYSQVPQLQGPLHDVFEDCEKRQLFDVEKGGKPGLLLISIATYNELKKHLLKYGSFTINPNHYRAALKEAANLTHQTYHGTHGLRWNYAQERLFTIQVIGGLSYEQALQELSWDMKHERASISEHYTRRL